MKSVGAIILIVLGAVAVLAGISLFSDGSIGLGAIQLLWGAGFIALGLKLRSKPPTSGNGESEPQ